MSDKLYEAATNSLVSEAAGENTFSLIMEAAFEYIDPQDFQQKLCDTEWKIRDEYGLSAMPSPWRSAKSVVLGAIKLGISLTDHNSISKGKSALQAEIKEKKKEGETPKTPKEKAWDAVNKLAKEWTNLTSPECAEILSTLSAWEK